MSYRLVLGRRLYVNPRQAISAALADAVVDRDRRVCQLCGRAVEEDEVIHLHHKQAVNKDGPSTFENLCVTHGYCNQRVGTKDWEVARPLAKAEGARWREAWLANKAAREVDNKRRLRVFKKTGKWIPK